MGQPHEPRRKQAIARYQAGDPAWARAMSRRPKTAATKTPDAIEQAVVELRQTLAQSGRNPSAGALRQAIQQQALTPVPSLRTIYRILQRHKKEGL